MRFLLKEFHPLLKWQSIQDPWPQLRNSTVPNISDYTVSVSCKFWALRGLPSLSNLELLALHRSQQQEPLSRRPGSLWMRAVSTQPPRGPRRPATGTHCPPCPQLLCDGPAPVPGQADGRRNGPGWCSRMACHGLQAILPPSENSAREDLWDRRLQHSSLTEDSVTVGFQKVTESESEKGWSFRVSVLGDPIDCSPLGLSVHGILQGIFPTQGLNPGLLRCGPMPAPRSPALQADSSPPEPQGDGRIEFCDFTEL